MQPELIGVDQISPVAPTAQTRQVFNSSNNNEIGSVEVMASPPAHGMQEVRPISGNLGQSYASKLQDSAENNIAAKMALERSTEEKGDETQEEMQAERLDT